MHSIIEKCLIQAELCDSRAATCPEAGRILFTGLAVAWRELAAQRARDIRLRDLLEDMTPKETGAAAEHALNH